jgi:integrase
MPRLQLTDVTIRALKSDSRVDYWDTKTPGFGIRVGANTKVFIAKVHNKRTTIGQYPDISLQDARREALGLKSKKKEARTKSPPFDEAVEQFLVFCEGRNRPRVVKERGRILRKHFVSEFHATPVAEITDEEMGEILDDLLDTPSEANHAFKEARTFFRWARKPPRRYIKISPLEGMEMPTKEKRRRRVLGDPELVSVWRAAIRKGYPYGTIVQLLILMGQRRGETAWLHRSWINQRDRLITIPGEFTKNKLDHCFPYGELTAQVLETIPRRNSTQLLFPSVRSDERPFSGWSKSKKELEDLPAIKPWTHHDLRRTFSTRLGQLNVPQRVNDRLLNHISEGEISPLGQVYNLATYLPQMREAVSHFDAHFTKLLAA